MKTGVSDSKASKLAGGRVRIATRVNDVKQKVVTLVVVMMVVVMVMAVALIPVLGRSWRWALGERQVVQWQQVCLVRKRWHGLHQRRVQRGVVAAQISHQVAHLGANGSQRVVEQCPQLREHCGRLDGGVERRGGFGKVTQHHGGAKQHRRGGSMGMQQTTGLRHQSTTGSTIQHRHNSDSSDSSNTSTGEEHSP